MSNDIESNTPQISGLEQILDVHIVNNTQYSLAIIRKNIEWGRWITQPISMIAPFSKDSFSSKGTYYGGIEGNAEYSILHGSFDVYWSLSHWGATDHRVTVNDPRSLYKINYTNKNNTITVYVNEKNTAKKYNILIMSDPQPWRLDTSSNNPNEDKSDWEAFNQKISDSIKKLEYEKNFIFGIINGDITEFGRNQTRTSFDKVYSSNLKTRLLLGLGNHDYANNVNDCMDVDNLNFSKNACARNSFFDIISRMDTYSIFLDKFSSDYNKNEQKGSGAYSWDMGDIHYVQLQNYPTYNVVLDHFAAQTIYVEKSLDWLENDLRNASARGKATILNYHDAYDHFVKETTSDERKRLEDMVKNYNVIAIFSGHSHFIGETNYGHIKGVRHYDSGALFKGDYFVVSVNGKCIDVDRYNGSSGSPVFKYKQSSVCGK